MTAYDVTLHVHMLYEYPLESQSSRMHGMHTCVAAS